MAIVGGYTPFSDTNFFNIKRLMWNRHRYRRYQPSSVQHRGVLEFSLDPRRLSSIHKLTHHNSPNTLYRIKLQRFQSHATTHHKKKSVHPNHINHINHKNHPVVMTMTYHDHPYHDFWCGGDVTTSMDSSMDSQLRRLDMVHFLDDFTARGLFEGLTSVFGSRFWRACLDKKL